MLALKLFLVTVEHPDKIPQKWLVMSSYHEGARQRVLKSLSAMGYDGPLTLKVHQWKGDIERIV